MIITVIYWPDCIEFIMEDGAYTGKFWFDYNLTFLRRIETYNPP